MSANRMTSPPQGARKLRHDARCRGAGSVFFDRRHPAASLPHLHVVTVAQSPRPGRCGRIIRTFMFAQRHEFIGWLHNTESVEAHSALPQLEPGARAPSLLLVPQMSLNRRRETDDTDSLPL